MTFRDREKRRYLGLKNDLFSVGARQPGTYRGKVRDFCLGDGHADENLFSDIRGAAIEYFAMRKIGWHDGTNRGARPSNHLCCSQSCCVNFLFPFIERPDLLVRVFRHVYPEIIEALPIESAHEPPLESRLLPFVAFEWIGEEDHLSEWRRKRRPPMRGANYTSADFILRFRRADGRIHAVLGEWKYTEAYNGTDVSLGPSGVVRLGTYREAYNRLGSVSSVHPPELYRALFSDPLYQLLRLQLLANQMEQAGELGVDIVSVLHISPDANGEFRDFNPSPMLRERFPGKGVLDVWKALVPADRFRSLSVESLLAIITSEARSMMPQWVDYLETRYGWK